MANADPRPLARQTTGLLPEPPKISTEPSGVGSLIVPANVYVAPAGTGSSCRPASHTTARMPPGLYTTPTACPRLFIPWASDRSGPVSNLVVTPVSPRGTSGVQMDADVSVLLPER